MDGYSKLEIVFKVSQMYGWMNKCKFCVKSDVCMDGWIDGHMDG